LSYIIIIIIIIIIISCRIKTCFLVVFHIHPDHLKTFKASSQLQQNKNKIVLASVFLCSLASLKQFYFCFIAAFRDCIFTGV